MTCLAAMGAGLSGFVESARAAGTNLVIDGCPVACGKLTFENMDQVVSHQAEIRDVLESEGVGLSNFACLLPEVQSQEAAIREKAMQYFEKGVAFAKELGGPYVWIDSYTPPLPLKKGVDLTNGLVYGQELRFTIPLDFSWDNFWRGFVDNVATCNEIAKKHKIGLLLEPRVGETTSNTDALLRLLDSVQDTNFGVILDTAHQHAQKEILPLAIEKLGDRLKYVHVADNDGRENKHLVPGNGNIDWDELFKVLKTRNFDGFFSIDLEKLPGLESKLLETKAFLKKAEKKYNL
jgi:sugar phosphate isomerase/epimerase